MRIRRKKKEATEESELTVIRQHYAMKSASKSSVQWRSKFRAALIGVAILAVIFIAAYLSEVIR